MGAHTDKRFNAAIIFTITAEIGHELDTQGIWRVFQLADASAPWQSSYGDGSPAPSIYWHSQVTFKGEGGGVDRLYELEIRPHFLLTQVAIFAYEKYGIRIAEIVNGLRLEGVLCVSARARFESVNTTFRPSEAEWLPCPRCSSELFIHGRRNHCNNGHES